MLSFDSWWKEGVFYQIYPRSFQDSNGDGIGDLRGIVSRLDYLSWLGISCIWINPIYRSPMYDFGYDISDYRSLEPMFGTIDDVRLLVEEAHNRNIRVIFDMVPNHTSHEHPWFMESASSTDNPKRDFYIWKAKTGNRPPNNWYAAFGGRAWTLDKRTDSYYLHSFLKEQPDLNWRNEEMVEAFFQEMVFWLDMGIDGFRLDVINLIFKDAGFMDNPCGWGGRPRPYDLQVHVYDRDQPETHEALKRFRKLIDGYDERILVGEIMVENPGSPEIAASYLGEGDDELHLSFDFSLSLLPWDAKKWRTAATEWYAKIPPDGWPSWVLSNHDIKRAFTRFKEIPARARIAAMFLLTQKGTPFIYYGEELGLPDRPVAKREIQDPLGKRYWPFHKGRDGARRPMVWDNSPQRGFSTGRPWLPCYGNGIESCDDQMKRPDSLLNFYRDLIQIRKYDEALRVGDLRWIDIEDSDQILAYTRDTGIEQRLVLLNFSNKLVKFDAYPVQRAIDSSSIRVIYSTIPGDWSAEESAQVLSLQPYQGLLCRGE